MRTKLFSIVAGLALLGTAPLNAQEFPNKVISMVVPFAAGGPTDTVARLIGVPMSKTLKQPGDCRECRRRRRNNRRKPSR